MKMKCQRCQGKGGKTKIVYTREVWMPCPYCHGKGHWFTAKKVKPATIKV